MNGFVEQADARAWAWLENLPRLEWREVLAEAEKRGDKHPGATMRQITEGQISVRMLPKMRQGQPGIHVSVLVPGHAKRFKGSGNDLPGAVRVLHDELWRAGIKLPFPEFPGVPLPQ